MMEKEQKQDIFSTLVYSKDETTGTVLSKEELAAETANLISAGTWRCLSVTRIILVASIAAEMREKKIFVDCVTYRV